MSRFAFTILWIALATGLLGFMALAWRARRRRDSGISLPGDQLRGDVLAQFPRVGYVSTTPEGEPFERVAVPGLSFKGWAEVTVHQDGVAIEVTGEPRVEIPLALIRGASSAGGRVGKIVERDGLALLGWTEPNASGSGRSLESSFRFDTPADQQRFAQAVRDIAGPNTQNSSQTTHTSQEDS